MSKHSRTHQDSVWNALRKRYEEVQGHAKQACPRTHREDGVDPPTKTLNQVKLTEWRPENNKDAKSERAWGPQEIGGATDAHEPQVVHKGQRLRSQQKKKLKVSYHAPSKNKNTTSRCPTNRVMDHTPIKTPRSPVNAPN